MWRLSTWPNAPVTTCDIFCIGLSKYSFRYSWQLAKLGIFVNISRFFVDYGSSKFIFLLIQYVKGIPSHHIRDDLKLGSFNIGLDDHSEMCCGALADWCTLCYHCYVIMASAAQLPGFGNSSRIRKFPLPHNIRDKFRKPGGVWQNFAKSQVKGRVRESFPDSKFLSQKLSRKSAYNVSIFKFARFAEFYA